MPKIKFNLKNEREYWHQMAETALLASELPRVSNLDFCIPLL